MEGNGLDAWLGERKCSGIAGGLGDWLGECSYESDEVGDWSSSWASSAGVSVDGSDGSLSSSLGKMS